MKSSYLFAAIGLFCLGEAVVSFIGCGSSDDAGDAGDDSACEPACPDALFDGGSDVPVVDEGVGDAGPTCAAACAKQTNLMGCPYPGCVNECGREQMACIEALKLEPFTALIQCEQNATFKCETTDSGVLPVADKCADAAALVAVQCFPPDAGDAGGDAGSCSALGSAAECEACCVDQNNDGHDTYELALTSCACETPGDCLEICSGSFCAAMTPDAGDPCSACLTKVLGPDGGCSGPVSSACATDPNCVAYEGCLKTNDCAALK